MVCTSILMKLLPVELLFFLTVLPVVRRKAWELFYYAHQIMIIILLYCFVFHSSLLLYYAEIPFVLYLLDKLRRWYTIYCNPGTITQIHAFDDLVYLEIDVRSIFCKNMEFPRLVGSVAYLNIPKIDFFQYHPMSIAYNSGNTLVFYIKTQGNNHSWSHRLAALDGAKNLRAYVEGPYTMVKRPADANVIEAEKAVTLARKAIQSTYSDNVLLVAGGSGFAGISSYVNDAVDMVAKLPEEEQKQKRIDVVVTVPHHKHLDCMKTILMKCLNHPFCHLRLYATYSKHPELKATSPKGIDAASFSPSSPDFEKSLEEQKLIFFTVDRPDLNAIIRDFSGKDITAFFCGPKPLEASLDKALKAQNRRYVLHSEVFDM